VKNIKNLCAHRQTAEGDWCIDWFEAPVSRWPSQLTLHSDTALVLASSSIYRAQLLRRLQRPFLALSPDIDESAEQPYETLDALALRLAQEKALAVADSLTSLYAEPPAQALIIGSDQIASLDGARLGKPGTREKAMSQLMSMRGRSVTFSTALCVRNLQTSETFTAVDKTVATLRPLEDTEAARYIDADQPLDCAGSFKVESLGISLFESVQTQDPTALIGLPLIALCEGNR